MKTTSIVLITVYHFNSRDTEAYARLIRGLRSTTRQLTDTDKLILVANGLRDGAEDPDQVLKDTDPSHPERIVPVVISENIRASGGLNAGIAEALKYPCQWIGQIQSSVVIGARWLEVMRSATNLSEVDGIGGRLVYEEQPDTIWSDGHYLDSGRTLDERHDWPLNQPVGSVARWMFPCLSAALFSAKTVRSVTEKYGNFVTECLSRYGDCTDVALRCARLGHGTFSFVAEAQGSKRRPSLNLADILGSQLLAAQQYYHDCFEKARKRAESSPKYAPLLESAIRRSIELHSAQYSPTRQPPPRVSKAEDPKWGA
jgi:hypothetical protein